jgi:uncharacterized damage-inducible protein DinB
MKSEIILLNYQEIRRRSIKLWMGLPDEFLFCKQDPGAMTLIATVRHVLEGEYLYHQMVKNRGSLPTAYPSPWEGKLYSNIRDEMEFAAPYRQSFLEMVRSTSDQQLKQVYIIREGLGQKRLLGDFLLRIAYHEAVHTGQILSALRILNINRPQIWD